MKRFLYLFAFLLMATLANAALWTAPTARDYTSSTPVYLKVNVNGELLTQSDQWFMRYNSNFAIAAFIDGECRGVVNTPDASDRYYLRIWGNSSTDNGKTITLKMLYGGLVFDMNKTYTFDGESHGVDVLKIDYPTGITATPASVNAQLPTTYDLASHISLQYQKSDGSYNATPANEATIEDLNYYWNLGNYILDFDIADNSTVLTVKEGARESNYEISVSYMGPDDRANYGARFMLSTDVQVNVTIPATPVASLTYTGNSIVCNIGDNVFRLIQPYITVAPDNATNKQFTLSADRDATAAGAISPEGEALKGGEWNIIATADDGSGVTCTIPVKVSTPVSFSFPRALILSKFSDTQCTLTNLVGDGYDASKVAVVITDGRGNEVPAATATVASQDGLKWTFRGKYVSDGDYKFYFTYDGNRMKSVANGETGDIVCAAELKLPENGWDWIMVPGNVSLMDGDAYNNNLFNSDANNRILDMRSETQLVYNDAAYGLFGDLQTLMPAGGMYKVKAKYADYSVIDLGQFGIYKWDASAISTAKMVSKGYNWIAYPCEFDCSVADWNTNDDIQISHQGDVIIGKKGFAEYNGTKWVASDNFMLEAGKGYIYYTESESPFVPALGCDEEPKATPAKSSVSYWDYDHTQYADNMAVVAKVEGMADGSDLSIGAFVNGECRGEGTVNESGKFFISVAGKQGEKVSFRILNTVTGETADLNETLVHSAKKGSMENPVSMSTENAISGVKVVRSKAQASADAYDLLGRKVNVASAGRGVYIVGGKAVVIE